MNFKLSQYQEALYSSFIRNRDNVGITRRSKKYVPHSEILMVVDVGLNHPMYMANDAWLEYLQASIEWWLNEPEFRKAERMSAIAGDYGVMESWDDPEEPEYKEL